MRYTLLSAVLALCAQACTPSTEHSAPSAAQAATSAGASAQATAPVSVTPGAPPKLEAQLKLELVKVVDGDTLHVRRSGKIEKLRLLCVDTEEKLVTGQAFNPTKPQTVFGTECAAWAETFFAELGHDGKLPELGLYFPGGIEKRDNYGRLLCHVILPDGRDFNLLLVELGKSPYFNKYGNSPIEHAAFLAAQKKAQDQHLGIWDPKTNEPKTAGVPSAKRPYAQLMPWWDARAEAIDAYRKLLAAGKDLVADAEQPAAVEEIKTRAAGREIKLFGEIDKLVNEPNGDLTLLLRATSKDHAIHLRVKSDKRELFNAMRLDDLTHEFRQNYVWAKGKLTSDLGGFAIDLTSPEQLERAGPEPVAPIPAPR